MGQVYIALGNNPLALRFLRQALAADPAYAPAYLELGIYYLNAGDSQTAYDYLLLAQVVDPASPQAALAASLLERYFP
jgi:lipoprotein NlpI